MSSTLRWFTSSYSSGSGGNCVEVAFAWQKSSYSNAGGGECVEVATCPHAVHVRDSKVSDGPAFAVAPDAWSAFLGWTG
ncbi:DUF397 domain-containing protein [Streptomyces anulatus]|uniref:DUF397 domain-containing protein n=1 Tax=Streptomyces TaxID=1883 RepID=UPI001B391F07|nr:DUF397 domain-containing protein [Streptomyces sp. 404i]MBQ1106619.1 DUF397 domain-containing protein [Streptomyces sp. 404i]